MSLTDEQRREIILNAHGVFIPSNDTPMCEAIESATAAPLLERIKEFEQQLEVARKDSGRYRWLRDCVLVDGEINESLYVAVESPDWPNKWALVGTELDAAVDAAITKEQE